MQRHGMNPNSDQAGRRNVLQASRDGHCRASGYVFVLHSCITSAKTSHVNSYQNVSEITLICFSVHMCVFFAGGVSLNVDGHTKAKSERGVEVLMQCVVGLAICLALS
jgi:hypothetical protein